MSRYRIYLFSGLSIFGMALLWLGYGIERKDIGYLIGLLAVAWLAFAFFYSLVQHTGWVRPAVATAILLRISLLFSTPNLTDDYYRYIWDGIQTTEGRNPYAQTPEEALTNTDNQALFQQLNSPGFYTVYPPVSQGLFALSAWLGEGNVLHTTFWLKVIILLFECLSIWLLMQLLLHYQRPLHWVLWYALNPMVILELQGNVHFEAVMISLSLLAIWFFVNKRSFSAGVALALAFGTKLWPLLFVPFFVKSASNWKYALRFLSAFVIVVLGSFALFWIPALPANIQQSLGLYFQYFEFNSSIFYFFRWASINLTDYETFVQLSRYLPAAAATCLAILFFAFKRGQAYLPQAMLFSLGIYLAFATTIHPWYITPLVAFSVLTRYRFAMLWSVVIPLGYIAYQTNPAQENFTLITVFYVLVYAWLLVELLPLKGLIQKQYLKRAAIKLQRIQALLPSTGKLVDIGTGNGALAVLLQQQGYIVTAVDIANKTAFDEVNPVLYNGQQIPLPSQQFNVSLLITVLHHTPNPKAVLQEAMRLGHQVVVMEDIYANPLQKYITWFTDSLVNMEFWGHPHTNKTDAEWKALFRELGVEVVFEEQCQFLFLFRQVTYVLLPVNRTFD